MNWKERLTEHAKAEHEKLKGQPDVTDLVYTVADDGFPSVTFVRDGKRQAVLLSGYKAFT